MRPSASLFAAAAVLAAGAAGCGGARDASVAQLRTTAAAARTTPTTGTGRPSWLAFSGCMRSNGVTRYPDPTGGGPPPKESLQQLGVTSAAFQAAETRCRHLLPGGGRPPDSQARQRVAQLGYEFARCVRAHGVPGFPDPDGSGRIPDPASAGVDQGSPAFQAANRACAAHRPPYVPSNSAYDRWARAHQSG